MEATNRIDFFREWLSDPLRVASVTPSGEALAELITREIRLADAPIIELGPGTGVFTRKLIANGIPEDRLALVEAGYQFAKQLRADHPKTNILHLDASKIGSVPLFGAYCAGAVVSGLPLLSMSRLKVSRILRGAFSHLRWTGAFYQFTYGFSCPVPAALLDRYGLKAIHVGHTFANFPPASVYRISRRARGRPI